MSYTIFSTHTLEDYNNADLVTEYYSRGFLFGRKFAGFIYETRSLRIDLKKFSLSSENRRVLRKFDVELKALELPIQEIVYDWRIHAMGKSFYKQKFEDVDFSANKIKELITRPGNFNQLFVFSDPALGSENEGRNIGYAICYQNSQMLHYAFPFYDLAHNTSNLGMYMMLQSIIWAQMHGKEYVYLGGVTRPADRYKLQFAGLQWWDHEKSLWNSDLELVKSYL